MFDEIKSDQVTPPVNSKPLSVPSGLVKPMASARVEDMFAEVDRSAKPEVFRTNQDNNLPPRGTVNPPKTGWKSNKIMVFGLLFGGLIVVAAGGYFGLKLATGNQPAINTVNTVVQEQAGNNEVIPEAQPAGEVNNPVVQPPPVITEPLDSDRDGLTDEEEARLGTDSNNTDTDQDGLTDREEVRVYTTDPLITDTDGDGFKDGDEVNDGYNPKGPGKLLQINK